MLNSAVLVLNKAYFPVHITSLKRAFIMLYQNVARAVDDHYQTFCFDSWSDLAVARDHETIGLVGRVIRVPRVILLTEYDRVPKRGVRFSRRNIMIRDRYQCQYCRRILRSEELNLDHVIPRIQGGLTTWENIATSCLPCNNHKGGRTPQQAGMRLMREPYKPKSLPLFGLARKPMHHDAWKPYLNVVDFSYWNVELDA